LVETNFGTETPQQMATANNYAKQRMQSGSFKPMCSNSLRQLVDQLLTSLPVKPQRWSPAALCPDERQSIHQNELHNTG